MRELLLNVAFFEIRAALLEQGQLVEFLVLEPSGLPLPRGSIFLGRVVHVVPTLAGAWVDLGNGTRALLQPAGFPKCDVLTVRPNPRTREFDGHYARSPLHEGLELPVQILRPARGEKAAVVSNRVRLEGFFLTLHPGMGQVLWPWYYPESAKHRVRSVLNPHTRYGEGFTVDLRSVHATEEELEREIARLRHTWTRLTATIGHARRPGSVYEPSEPLCNVLLQLADPRLERIWVDDPRIQTQVQRLWQALLPNRPISVLPYKGRLGLFQEKRVDEQLRQALQSEIPLPRGGVLRFESTHAGTVVDVDSHAQVAPAYLQPATLAEINRSAARMLAQQLRLRSHAGNILVDFIAPHSKRDKHSLVTHLFADLRLDRHVSGVHVLASGGLVHIRRRFSRPSLAEQFLEDCPSCGRSSVRVRPSRLAMDLLHRALNHVHAEEGRVASVVLELEPRVLRYLQAEAPHLVQEFERHTGTALHLRPADGGENYLRLLLMSGASRARGA